MKAKPNIIASRHPQVVMVFDQEEDMHGASEILSSQFERYRAIPMNSETTRFLSITKPLVVLFTLNNVSKCIEYYSEIVEKSILTHPHYSVVLCSNKESALAFRCCMKGLFDNYFVYQPIYEKFRLVMIVHNGLVTSSFDNTVNEFNEYYFEEIDEKLAQLIDESSECKKELLAKVELSRVDIQKATESYQQQPQQQQLSSQEIFEQVTQNHVKPLLSLLESDIKSGLDSMISQLMEAKTSAKKQENQGKGLINHKASIKRKPHSETSQVDEKGQSNDKSQGLINSRNSEKAQLEAQAKLMKTASEHDALNEEHNNQENIANTNSQHILVVEDNALYRDMLVNVLSKEKFTVDQAEDGLCALKKIKQCGYDLIIMDLFMPKLDGLNVTKKIRQASGGKDIPVIALTGNKNKELIRKWAAYGLKGYIIKPSTKEEILSSVTRVFSNETEAV